MFWKWEGGRYPCFHVLKLVLELGEPISGRGEKFLDGRDEAVAGRSNRRVAQRAVIFEFLFDTFQAAPQLIHLLVQLDLADFGRGPHVRQIFFDLQHVLELKTKKRHHNLTPNNKAGKV